MRSLPLVLLALTSSFALAHSAHAQNTRDDAPSARLDFSSEGEGCPDAGAFTDEVSARIGRVGFDAASERVAVVRLARTPNEALVSAEFGGNTRVFRDADCRVAAEAAAAAIAVWLDEATVPVYGVAMMGAELPEPASANTAPDEGVLLRVTTNLTAREPDEDFSFHIETNTGSGSGGFAHFFDRLCLLPCETRVTPGVHQFGFSRGNLPAYALEELTRIDGDSHVHVEVRRMSGVSLTGRWFVVAALLAGLPMTIAAIVKRDDWGTGAMWGVVGVTSGLLIGGSLMISFSDDGGTEVTVRPL